MTRLKRTRGVALCLALVALLGASGPALRIGSDISYAPVEFYDAHKHVVGLDYDLAVAIAKQMGRTAQFQNHDFNSIIPALQSGKFDAVMSAMSDTRERERSLTFVDYFLAGSGILVRKGNSNHIFDVAALCGMTVDLQKGTSQEALLRSQSEKCRQAGLSPIKILSFSTDDAALRALLSGKSSAHISDYPVVAYLARTLSGGHAYDVVGKQFGVVPYGIAIAKSNVQLRDQLRAALLRVIASGEYDRILQKWNLQQGALRSAPISAGTLFQR